MNLGWLQENVVIIIIRFFLFLLARVHRRVVALRIVRRAVLVRVGLDHQVRRHAAQRHTCVRLLRCGRVGRGRGAVQRRIRSGTVVSVPVVRLLLGQISLTVHQVVAVRQLIAVGQVGLLKVRVVRAIGLAELVGVCIIGHDHVRDLVRLQVVAVRTAHIVAVVQLVVTLIV